MTNEELEILYKKYYINMCAYASKRISQTYIHDAVIDIFIALSKDPRSIADYPHIGIYIYKCLRNKCTDVLRCDPYHMYWKTCYIDDELSFVELCGTTEVVNKSVIDDRLSRIIESLPNRMAQVIRMSIIDEIKPQEISEILGLSVRTILNTKYVAMQRVRKQLLNPQ